MKYWVMNAAGLFTNRLRRTTSTGDLNGNNNRQGAGKQKKMVTK